MPKLLENDNTLHRMADAIFVARQDAAQALEDMLTEEAKDILSAVPYDAPDWEQRCPTVSLCDGMLADPFGKSRDVFHAVLCFHACAVELNCIITKAGLTQAERTVIIRKYIDGIKDNQMINKIDGYDNAGKLLETAVMKICRMMEKEDGRELS